MGPWSTPPLRRQRTQRLRWRLSLPRLWPPSPTPTPILWSTTPTLWSTTPTLWPTTPSPAFTTTTLSSTLPCPPWPPRRWRRGRLSLAQRLRLTPGTPTLTTTAPTLATTAAPMLATMATLPTGPMDTDSESEPLTDRGRYINLFQNNQFSHVSLLC